jgi:hypothetical protein
MLPAIFRDPTDIEKRVAYVPRFISVAGECCAVAMVRGFCAVVLKQKSLAQNDFVVGVPSSSDGVGLAFTTRLDIAFVQQSFREL